MKKISKAPTPYGTKFGTTKGIVGEMEKTIQENGIEMESHDLKESSLKEIPSLKDYDGVLIGTSIKMKMWTKHVKKYVQKQKAELKQMQDKLGFFICCGTAAKTGSPSAAISFSTTSLVRNKKAAKANKIKIPMIINAVICPCLETHLELPTKEPLFPFIFLA